jgi:hypothetical protein
MGQMALSKKDSMLFVRLTKKTRRSLDYIAEAAGFTTSGYVREMCESTMAQDGGARALAFKVRTMDALNAQLEKERQQTLPFAKSRPTGGEP